MTTSDTSDSRQIRLADRFDAIGETIFTEISRLALQHEAINLGQGFPNFDGPDFVKQAAINAIRDGHGQYARSIGIPELNRAITDRFNAAMGISIDPDREVTVTSGCSEAIAASMIGLINPGDEVVLIEPFYDSYPACLAMAGATASYVTLRPPDFELSEESLREAITNRTRAIIINTPHNPTGRVFSKDELEGVARVCREHNLIAITDEVYEHLVFDGEHLSLASLPGMYERTLTLSSLGKTFSLTGWKVGWAIGPPDLTKAVRTAHQFITFATATPLQHGAVAALRAPETYFKAFIDDYRRKRDLLVDGLARLGFNVYPPAGTYFVLADHTPFGFDDDVTFCKHLIEKVGVAAIPPSAFYHDPNDGRKLVRFAFCKDEETLREALGRMSTLTQNP